MSFQSEFVKAVRACDLSLVKETFGKEDHENTLHCGLCFAAQHKHLDILKYLIGAGMDVNACHGVPLTVAAHKGNVDVVKLLLKNKAHIHSLPGRCLLCDDVCHFLQFWYRYNDIDERHRPIRVASKRGHFEVIKVFLEHYRKIGETFELEDENIKKVQEEIKLYKCALYCVHQGLLPIELRAHIFDYISFDNKV